MPIPSLLDPNISPSVLPSAVGGLPPLPQLSSAPASAPATPDSIAGPSAIPQLPSSGGLRPLVTSPRQQQEEQLQQSLLPKPGQPGFWHALGRVASKIGNVAGDIVDPSAMALIPGTDLNRVMQHNSNQTLLTSLQKQDQDEQDAASKRNLQGETAAHLGEETAEMPATQQAKLGLESAQTDEATKNAAKGPDLSTAYSTAVNAAIAANRDPSTDPVVQHIADAITSIQKQPTGAGTKTVQLQVGGKPHQVLIDEKTGKTVSDLGESGEKPPTVNVNANTSALDRETKQFGAAHQKGVDTAGAQLEKIEDARNMINGNAEAQGLGIPKVLTALVGGQGTGVRITQAELTSIAHARGIQGDFEGTLNKWEGKGALSRAQQQQLTQIMDDVRNRIVQKQAIHAAALDAINGASTREQIIAADKDARGKITQLENGAVSGGGKAFSLSQAMALPFNKGKNEADVKADLQKHGYTVNQ